MSDLILFLHACKQTTSFYSSVDFLVCVIMSAIKDSDCGWLNINTFIGSRKKDWSDAKKFNFGLSLCS